MSSYYIFENENLINTLVASEEFIKKYCFDHGYTFELRPEAEEPQLTPEELRENAYKTMTAKEDGTPLLFWDNKSITVDQAADLWTRYSAEGSDVAAELQTLIAEAKAYIRALYPNDGGEA